MLKFSIIIASFNGKKLLRECMRSVFETKYPSFEVIVVDDGSVDGSIKVIREFQKKHPLILIQNERNLGLVASRNKAIQKAKGEILVFLDNDTKVDKNWLGGLIDVFSDESVGAAQCKIFDFHKVKIIQEIGMKLIPYTGFGTTLGRGEKDKGQYNTPVEIISLGAALAVKKDVTQLVGDFDQKLFHYTDDLDFSWRIWISGKRVVSAPNSKVYHYTHIHKPTYKLYYNLSKNSLRMILKNYETFNVIKYLPLSIIFNIAGGIFVLFTKGNIIALLGVLVGLGWNIFNSVDTFNERSKVNKFRRVGDSQIFPKIMIQGNIFTFYKRYFRLAKLTDTLVK